MFLVNSYQFGGGAAPSLLLDLYPATAAYSLRKLRTAYTGNAIRVRRTTDNVEQDIGFSGVDFDLAAFNSFINAGAGMITKVYNQGTGGAIYDAYQSTVTLQCELFNSSIPNTNISTISSNGGGSNSKPPLNLFNRIDGIITAFGVNKIDVLNTINYLAYNSGSLGNIGGIFQGGTNAAALGLGAFDNINIRSISTEDLNKQLGYWNIRSGNIYMAKNGATETNAGTFAYSAFSVNQIFGRSILSSLYFRGKVQELIFYTTDESANKAAIETNINDYYGIY
jgi:hypothetical protein